MVRKPYFIVYCYITYFPFVALRIHWCRTRARAFRWSEEVTLLEEEMRRVLAYLSWYEDLWNRRAAAAQSCEDLTLSEGQRAYALRQAEIRSSIHKHFSQLWRDVPSWISTGKVVDEKISEVRIQAEQ